MTILTVDLSGFDSSSESEFPSKNPKEGDVPVTRISYILEEISEAKRAVKEFGITRECDKVDKIIIMIPNRVAAGEQQFWRNLFGPAARKIGAHVLIAKVEIQHINPQLFIPSIQSYFDYERDRIAERAINNSKTTKP
jgi:hypothetical protein